MSKEVHVVKERIVTDTNEQFIRLRTGLGLNEKGILKALFWSCEDTAQNTRTRLALLVDPDAIGVDSQSKVTDGSAIWAVNVNAGIVPSQYIVFPDIEFPSDLLFNVNQNAADNFSVFVYYTKEKSSNNDMATLMMKYGIHIQQRDNIEEVGLKSPFADRLPLT